MSCAAGSSYYATPRLSQDWWPIARAQESLYSHTAEDKAPRYIARIQDPRKQRVQDAPKASPDACLLYVIPLQDLHAAPDAKQAPNGRCIQSCSLCNVPQSLIPIDRKPVSLHSATTVVVRFAPRDDPAAPREASPHAIPGACTIGHHPGSWLQGQSMHSERQMLLTLQPNQMLFQSASDTCSMDHPTGPMQIAGSVCDEQQHAQAAQFSQLIRSAPKAPPITADGLSIIRMFLHHSVHTDLFTCVSILDSFPLDLDPSEGSLQAGRQLQVGGTAIHST